MVYWFKEKNVEFIVRDDSIKAGWKINASKTNGMCNGLGKRNGEKREVIIFQVQGNLVMFSLSLLW